MDYGTLYEQTGAPFRGRQLERLKRFLDREGLCYDEAVGFSVVLTDRDGEIAGTGSLDRNVLKCIAVAEQYRGEGLTARLLTLLQNRAAEEGFLDLLLFTKPGNRAMFEPLGFEPVIGTEDALLMENRKNGLARFLRGLRRPKKSGVTGAAVMNCDPFTRGHRYLLEQALVQCDTLHVFLVSEDRSFYSTALRRRCAEAGTRNLPGVYLHDSGNYLISCATFPTYFLKGTARAEQVNCELDIRLFRERIAPALGITKRFVGTEPLCGVTARYNEALRETLPAAGIELIEIPRLEIDGEPVSASEVRKALAAGDWVRAARLAPESTLAILREAQK